MAARHNAFAALEAANSDDDAADAALADALQRTLSLAELNGEGGGNGARRRRAKSPTRSASPIVRGRVPNIHWRSMSAEELRSHFAFRALPPVDAVAIGGPSTYAWVRQDDPLWSELHAGVLTSRLLLGILGFSEPRAAKALGLPAGMAGGRQGERAFWALRQQTPDGCGDRPSEPTPHDLELNALNAKATTAYNERLFLAAAAEAAAANGGGGRGNSNGSRRVRETARRRQLGAGCSINEVRCAWGSAQEASTLRSLLEEVVRGQAQLQAAAEPGAAPAEQQPPLGAYLEEAGLCMLDAAVLPALLPHLHAPAGAGAPFGLTSLPPIGASPDAFLVRADGTRVVVEVKNVCPFVADRKRPGAFCVARPESELARSAGGAAARAASAGGAAGAAAGGAGGLVRGPHERVLVSHVPQLQLEMLCAGVQTGLLVSSSACAGLNVFEMPRDDAYLALLLYFVQAFHTRHVLPGQPPGQDFFPAQNDPAEAALYNRLLARTAELARTAVLERHVAEPWRTDERAAFFV